LNSTHHLHSGGWKFVQRIFRVSFQPITFAKFAHLFCGEIEIDNLANDLGMILRGNSDLWAKSVFFDLVTIS